MNPVLLALAVTLAAPGPKDPPEKPSSIVGEWECVEAVGNGRKATAEDLAGWQIAYEFTADGKNRVRWGTERSEHMYSTDPKKDPAELDVVADPKAKKSLAIYKVEKDTLTICMASAARMRVWSASQRIACKAARGGRVPSRPRCVRSRWASISSSRWIPSRAGVGPSTTQTL